MNHTLKRIILFIAGVGLGLSLLTGTASAAPSEHASDKAKTAKAEHAKSGHADSEPAPSAPVAESSEAPDHSSKDQDCNGTHHSDTGNGANDPGPHAYSNTCDEEVASGNGVGDGEASGRPCAGCVGNADDKNPQGQAPDAKHDGNNGYECDRKGEEDGGNNGIAFGNPAHTGCLESEQQPPVNEEPNNPNPNTPNVPDTPSILETPEVPTTVIATALEAPCAAGEMQVDHNGDGVLDAKDCVPICGEGPMTVDVNGDGQLNGADCALSSIPAAVLGISFESPAAAGPQVLGASFEQGNAASASLARTGALVEPAGLLMSALALIAFGSMLLASRRVSGVRSSC